MASWNFEQGTSNPGPTNALVFPSDTKLGSLLIAACCVNPTAYDPTEPGVTDTLGNLYTRIRRIPVSADSQVSVWWYAISKAAGPNTVTITAGNAIRAYLVGEWSCDLPILLETETGQISSISTTTDSGSSGSITPADNDRLLVGFWGTTNAGITTLNAGTNWTERTETGEDGLLTGLCQLSSRVLSTPSSVSATWTAGATSQGTAAIASFMGITPSIARQRRSRFPKPVLRQPVRRR